MEVIQLDTNKYKNIIENSEILANTKFPKIIELQTMSYCNGNCIVCPYKDLDIKQCRMPDDIIERLLNEIIEHKDTVERFIPYLNNEPSFDKRMLSILRKMKNKDIVIEVSTNISNWELDELDSIIEEDLIQDLRISFFGHNKELYEELMTGLNFEKNAEKVKYLLNINRLANNKVDIEIIVVLLPTLNATEIRDGLNELFNNPKIHFFGFLDRCGKVKLCKNDLAITESSEVIGCSLTRPYERCCIYANGNVVLCSQDWEQEVVLGNVYENTIEEVWNSDKAKHIRNIVLGKEKCPNNFLCTRCKLAILKDKNEEKLNFCGDKYMTATGGKNIEQ